MSIDEPTPARFDDRIHGGIDDRADHRTADLGFARVDVDRAARTGDPEVVYGAGKSAEQVVGILTTLHREHPDRTVLATRLGEDALDAVGLRD